jgi:hypothetical protein
MYWFKVIRRHKHIEWDKLKMEGLLAGSEYKENFMLNVGIIIG